MTGPFKIAYALPMTWSCGGILAPFAQASELAARGHEVRIFSPEAGPVLWYPLQVPLSAFPETREVQESFDAVLFVGDSFRKVRFPHVRQRFLLLQGKDYLWSGGAERVALLQAYADPQYHVLAVSGWLAEFVAGSCGARRVSIIWNGVDPARFFPNHSPRARPRLLIEGNLPDTNKNLIDALEVASRVRQHQQVEIWVMARRFVQAGSLVDRVFADPPYESIPGIYQQCDLLIKTSFMEGFGLPLLEAMACGCVPVTYSSGGVLDFCRHDENSLVAGVGNLPLMVWNILRFLSDPVMRSRLRANALATAREHTWSRAVARLENLMAQETGRP